MTNSWLKFKSLNLRCRKLKSLSTESSVPTTTEKEPESSSQDHQYSKLQSASAEFDKEDKVIKSVPSVTPGTRTSVESSVRSSATSMCLPLGWIRTLPKHDQGWISKALFTYNERGKPELDFSRVNKLWWYPPQPSLTCSNKPGVDRYFSQPLCLWMPRKLWQVQLVCPHESCSNIALVSAGLYLKVRQVVDVAGMYNLAGEYLVCPSCKRKVISWNHNIISQLDIGHQIQFPCILTARLACDLKVIRLLRQRGLGNSSNQIQQKLQEQHSEVWLQKTIQYLTDCQGFASAAVSRLLVPSSFEEPPAMTPVPKHRWLMRVYALDVLQRLEEIKASITSKFGRVLKIDSTKKVVKKLAGRSAKTAMWATNVGNEYGQVIMSILTAGEGYGLDAMVKGIVQRYSDAKMPPPELLYVDRDCCGSSPIKRLFSSWENIQIRLDIWHFMRRISVGCNTDSHQLYGSFMGCLSNCIFKWDQSDVDALKNAKRAEMQRQLINIPSDADVMHRISRDELARHCRRTTRGTEEVITLITQLIQTFDSKKGRDTLGVPLINSERMKATWESQKKHVACIQDPIGAQLYIQTGTVTKGGVKLPIYRCARGSTSLECFHLHLNRFIPGTTANATMFQAYLLDGLSRWNEDRSAAVTSQDTSEPHSYSGLLRHTANALGEAVLGKKFNPSYVTPRKYTGEHIGVEYLYQQTGQVLQNHSETIEEIQNEPGSDMDEEQEEDEGFAEITEFEDLTVPTLENPMKTLGSSAESAEKPQLHIPSDAEFRSLWSGTDTSSSVIHPTEEQHSSPPHDEQNVSDQLQIEQPEKDAFQSADTMDDSLGPDNIPGYRRVYELAEYLVELRSASQALTMDQANTIIKLWNALNDYDKQPTIFSPRHKPKLTQGRFRATKTIVKAGVESTNRSFLGPNTGPAQWPDCNRYVEATISLLCDIFPSPRTDGGIRWARWSLILKSYSHIRQCILGNGKVMSDTALQLPELNKTTLTQWYNRRGKAQERQVLEQGLHLPATPVTAEESLPPALPQPQNLPAGSADDPHLFPSPQNTAGMAKVKKRVIRETPVVPVLSEVETTTTTFSHMPPGSPNILPVPKPAPLVVPPFVFVNPIGTSGVAGGVTLQFPIQQVQAATPSVPYTTQRHRKRKLDDEKAGIFKRKYNKTKIPVCKSCQKERLPPSHQQYFGNWYCQETATENFDQWKAKLKNKGYGKKTQIATPPPGNQ